MTDPDEMVTCCACGVRMPALFMHAATVAGQYVCGPCWGDDEFEDEVEHNRD